MEIDEIQKKPTGKRYTLLLTCAICNGDAHGYNFDAISCESCKAFFRRNALKPSKKFKCYGTGNCNITFNQKKRCKKCRLEKCLRSGMRKEWILTDEEKQKKRIKIEQNRQLKQICESNQQFQEHINKELPIDNDLIKDLKNISSSIINEIYLTENDWLKIEYLENIYLESLKLNEINSILKYPLIQPIESTLELFRIPIYLSSMRLISYFKRIPEFQQLNKDEQVYLVKLNTLTIVFLHSIFIYDKKNEFYHEKNTNDPLFLEKHWINTINKQFHYEIKQIQNNLIDIIQLDEKLIKIFFLIILFSTNFTSKYLTININTSDIFKAQNIYNELFYKYSLHQYGLNKSLKIMLQYTNNVAKIQKLVNELTYEIHDYMDITQLSPLMQSIL